MAKLEEIDSRYFMMVMNGEIGTIGDADISASCPICNEGKSYGRKKRFHLYIKDSYDSANVKCFNCGYSSNMYGFLKEHHPSEFQLYQNEKRGSSLNELKMSFGFEEESKESKKSKKFKEPQESIIDTSQISSGLDFSVKEPKESKESKNVEKPKEIKVDENLNEGHDEKALSASEIGMFSSGLDFGSFTPSDPSDPSEVKKVEKPKVDEPINEDGVFVIPPVKGFTELPQEAIDYIRKRGIEPQENWLYSPKNNKVMFNKAKTILSEFIIIPLTKGNKWYGFQALAWKHKQFFVYMVTGNSGHKHWNFYNVDKTKEVFIFEGVYDAMSSGLENSIAQLGANLGEESLKELEKPIFCLDNQHVDEKAKEETLKYLELGYSAFIWPEGADKFKDTNDLRKINVPYEKIANMITNNVNKGMKAVLKMKMMR